jgi:hypothetical protein
MKFYEVIKLNVNDLPDYLCTLWPFKKRSNRPHKRGSFVFHVHGGIHYAVKEFSPTAWLHCIRQGLHTSPAILVQRVRSGDLGGRATEACRPIRRLLVEKCCHLQPKWGGAPSCCRAWCGEENHLTALAADLPGNGGTVGCQALFKYKQSDDLAFSNTAPNVNRRRLRKCVSVDVWGSPSDQTCEFHILFILSLLNIAL